MTPMVVASFKQWLPYNLRGDALRVMAALVAAIAVSEAAPFPIEMAGTRPAMTRRWLEPIRLDRLPASPNSLKSLACYAC